MHYLIAIFIFLISFTGTAFASEVPIEELVKPLLDAAKSGNWPWAIAAALVLTTALARRFGAKRWPWLASGPGAALLLLVGSFGAALATAFSTGAEMSWMVFHAALGVAVTAAGGYSLIKTLVVPLLISKLGGRWGWLDSVLSVVTAVFPDKLAQAKMAGDKAVKANPGKGLADILPEPRDVP